MRRPSSHASIATYSKDRPSVTRQVRSAPDGSLQAITD